MCLQFADMLAIAGDAADNVPGIKGVGFKTAPGLLKSYGDLEGVFANASEVTRKVPADMHCISTAASVSCPEDQGGQMPNSVVCFCQISVYQTPFSSPGRDSCRVSGD